MYFHIVCTENKITYVCECTYRCTYTYINSKIYEYMCLDIFEKIILKTVILLRLNSRHAALIK